MSVAPDVKTRGLKRVEELKSSLGITNVHAVPKVVKVVLSMGLGSCLGDKKKIDESSLQLSRISGQKPIVTRARNSVSGFRLREGMEVGCCVTLRGERMFSFLTRLFFVVLPRVRDFRGLKTTSFDGRGNYSFGVLEQTVFPEVDPESVTFSQGLNVTIVTTAQSDESARLMLSGLGLPFSKE
jgi:large subunit ribosomal protein L5